MTEAQKALVEKNQKLVFAVLNRKFPSLTNDEDAISSGMLGLCLAARNFDETKNVSFSSFAWKCIFNEIGMFLRKKVPIEENEIPYVVEKNSEGEEFSQDDKSEHQGEEDRGFEHFEISEDVRKALSKLPERQRKVIEEYMSGKTFVEMAKERRISKQGMNIKFKRAARLLEGRLDGYD